MKPRSRLSIALVLISALVVVGVPAAGAQDPEPLDQTTTPEAVEPAPAGEPAAPAAEAAPEAQKAPDANRVLPGDDREPSKTSLRLKGLKGGKLTVGKKLTAAGTVRPFVQGSKVTIYLRRGKKVVKSETVPVRPKQGADYGKFSFEKKLVQPGRYSVQAIHKKSATLGTSKAQSRAFRIRYPDLRKGNESDAVRIFNNLLADQGYVNDQGDKFDSATGRAALAFRKVNGMARKESATAGMFKKLAKGKGGFKLKHPGAGKHVETDLSRQVMVLAKGGEVDEIYHISSGAPATPTILGKYRFYRKDAGYNSIGMYYSAYFIRGYATHGYRSVPNYPASHGCLRNPIPDSRHIYKWIDIGDPIYVYR